MKSIFILLLFCLVVDVQAQDLRVQPCADLYPFYHGVASGDPLTDRVIIWTRISPDEDLDTVEVEWRMALDTGMTQIVADGLTQALAERDMTVKVDVTGLSPNTFYYYDFRALSHYSLRGRTKTLPTGEIDRMRLAVASCSNYEHGYFNAYKYLAERNDIDLVVHLGDYIYEYATGGYSADIAGRTAEPAHETITLDDYRMRHSHYKLDPDLRAAHQQFPWITVWDDHESANDAWMGGAQNHDLGEGDWNDRKAASKQAYHEWLPVRGDEEVPLFRSFDLGSLARLIMLDTRLHGRDEQVGLGSDAVGDLSRSLLGDDQKDWLEMELLSSMASWNVLGQQVMMAPLRAFGAILNTDQWDGYQADRTWLYQRLQLSSFGKSIVLTGDIHTAWANELPLENYDPVNQQGSVGVEYICTSVTSPGLPFIPSGAVQVFNSHVRYVNLSEHGFMVLELTPEQAQADWVYVNSLLSSGGGTFVGASYVTTLGVPFTTPSGTPLVNADFEQEHAPDCPFTDEEEEEEEEEEEPTHVLSLPDQIMLTSLAPNPFRHRVQLQFGLAEAATIEVEVVDLSGRSVAGRVVGHFSAGLNYLELRLSDLSPGVYLLSLHSGEQRIVRRIVKAG